MLISVTGLTPATTMPNQPLHHLHIGLTMDELIRLRALASKKRIPMTQLIRTWIAEAYGDHKTREQKDLEFFGIGEK